MLVDIGLLFRPAAACALAGCWQILTLSLGAQPPELDPLIRAASAAYLKGDYDAARQSLDQAWSLAENTPPNDPARYDLLKRRFALESAAGQLADADGYLQQAITWRQNVFGESDPGVLNDQLEDANLSRGMHDYERALLVLQQVRDAHMSAGGFETAAVADDLSRIAQIYMDQQQPEKVPDTLTAAIGILAKLNGEDHYSLLADLDRLGEVQITLRQYEQAEQTYRRDLVIRERVFGKDNANLITTVDGLAYARFGQKKYDEAEPVFQRLVALWESSAGKEHPMVALALDKVAVFYRDQKKWDQAKEAGDRANAIRAHFLATGLAQEATQRVAEGKIDEAKVLFRRALAVLDPPHPVFEELRKQIEGNLKSLTAPAHPPRKAKVPPERRN